MEQFVRDMILRTLQLEKGFVNHPNDRGGATKHGVSLRVAKTLDTDHDGHLDFDFDDDGDVDVDDIKLITIDDAISLFYIEYYLRPNIDKLPRAIQPFVFDMGVHHGQQKSIYLLQEVLNKWAGIPGVKIDGIVGNQTIAAAKTTRDRYGDGLLVALVMRRDNYFKEIVRKDATQKDFIDGWLDRSIGFYPIIGK